MSGERILRRALLANAIFSGFSGLALWLAAATIAGWLGSVDTALVRSLGPGLLLFAGWVAWTATRRSIPLTEVRLIIGADVAWVVASMLLLALAAEPLSRLGWWLVMGVAEIVAAFAGFQYYGLRTMTRRTGPELP